MQNRIDPHVIAVPGKSSMASRILTLFYGIASYAAFVVAILYAIGFVSGLPVPKDIDGGRAAPLSEAVIVDLLLLLLFAVQHSVMARPWFKQWWTRFVPEPIERSTYVLLASLCLLLLFWQWRPIPEAIWRVEDMALALSMTVLSLLGWALVFLSTFLINHFELFGLHQVANNLRGKPMPVPEFRTPLLYKFVRHPIYLGVIIAVWSTPVMTAGHLLFAVVMTAYILIGIILEERDLIALFGDEYRRYKDRVSMLLPWRSRE